MRLNIRESLEHDVYEALAASPREEERAPRLVAFSTGVSKAPCSLRSQRRSGKCASVLLVLPPVQLCHAT